MVNELLKPVLERLPENNRLELIWKLAQVDFRRRYYDNLLGLFWALINPLFRVAIYYFVFTYIFKRSQENYALYLFSALLFWMFFSEGTKKGINILKSKKYLIENIQFNKVDLFTSATFSVLLGFMFNITAYLAISLGLGIPITINILFMPLLILNTFLLVLAVGLLLATLNIYLKDIVHMWDIVLLMGFWLTPIFWNSDELKGYLVILLYANPMAGIIVNARNAILYGQLPDMTLLIFDFSYTLILLALALYLFKKFSHKAAEQF